MPSPTPPSVESHIDDVMIGVDPPSRPGRPWSLTAASVVWPRSVSRLAGQAIDGCAGSRPAFRMPAGRSRGLGAPLTAWLRADGVEVLDVPAKLARKVRMLSTGHGRKSDEADVWSVGVAALTTSHITAAAADEAAAVLRALTEHRDDLVRTRTQTANRLHSLLTQLIPAGHPRGLTGTDAAAALRTVRPRTPVGRTLRRLAVELVAELRRLDRRIAGVGDETGCRGRRLRHDLDVNLRRRNPRRREAFWPGPVRSAGSGPVTRSPRTPAWHRLKCHPVTSRATGSPGQAIGNSTTPYTSSPLHRPEETPQEGPTTRANVLPGRATKKPSNA
jgi:hypothetical protein